MPIWEIRVARPDPLWRARKGTFNPATGLIDWTDNPPQPSLAVPFGETFEGDDASARISELTTANPGETFTAIKIAD